MKDEMDILKEVGLTAAAHGSIALSEILGKKITLQLPSLDIVPRERIAKEININGMVTTLQMQVMGGLHGKIVFLLEEKSSFQLINICYEKKHDLNEISLYTEMGMSVIKEIGNIIMSSYISALGLFLKKLIIPTFPILMNAPMSEIIRNMTEGYNGDHILSIAALFEEESHRIKGNFWLILTADAAEAIIAACKDILKEIQNAPPRTT